MPAPRLAPVRAAPVRLAAALAGGLLLAAALAGCGASADQGGSGDVADQGYQSGDGTTRTWPVADRGEPVELAGTDFAGAAVDVAAWRGDVVVLNTWYAACPPCRAEAPDLVQLAADFAADGLHLVGINGTDDAGAAQAFERTFAVTYPSIADTDGSAIAALQGAVPVQAVPTTVVLDRQGRVAARILGAADPATLEALVGDALAEPAATGSDS
ncbi:TlpA family protein disulfide reductase [Pengzhenrongella sicca]|uniref:TlpA family protein disulfide reductase n=1 Tax=Pengzhenrongella sicca TaxID=2819238 RepID=A0A8A4ZF75_9MICO|nr:TlpA disulfide reductase family protein [Pengzhenrongella sicca]QTE29147.1 TlpA family protein disulfide reductase [Pengzhenrongella sicca]